MTDDANVFDISVEYSVEDISSTLEPISGARIVGKLDKSLSAAYCEMANAELELDAISETMQKRAAFASIEHLGRPTEMAEAMRSSSLFHSEEEASQLYQRVARWEELRATFWYQARLTFNCWNDWLEVRDEFRVVSLGKKYTKE